MKVKKGNCVVGLVKLDYEGGWKGKVVGVLNFCCNLVKFNKEVGLVVFVFYSL